jgi:glycosyltransferase involved in cell wall biosynthesis
MQPGSRPKVVHVVVAGEIGGAERFLVNLATHSELSGADHCLALMTPNPELRTYFADASLRIRDRGLVKENPLAYLWRSFGPADIAWLERVLLEEKADLLHAHTFGSHILAVRAALRRRLPVVRTEHGIHHYRDPSCALFRHWALRHTDRIIAVSAFVAATIGALAPCAREKTQVVLNGVDMTYFAPIPARSEGPFTIASVCRLSRVKRVALAIEAVSRTPSVHLDIVGEGGEREKLQGLVRKRGLEARVRFLGRLHDPRLAIAASDAIINCTREEGLGIAVIEAAAMQRPAIAFDGGGIPEIVQDRRTGWLAKEDSVDGIAAVVAEATANRRQAAEFGRRAREWVESRFGIDGMYKSYAAIYQELAQGRRERKPA